MPHTHSIGECSIKDGRRPERCLLRGGFRAETKPPRRTVALFRNRFFTHGQLRNA